MAEGSHTLEEATVERVSEQEALRLAANKILERHLPRFRELVQEREGSLKKGDREAASWASAGGRELLSVLLFTAMDAMPEEAKIPVPELAKDRFDRSSGYGIAVQFPFGTETMVRNPAAAYFLEEKLGGRVAIMHDSVGRTKQSEKPSWVTEIMEHNRLKQSQSTGR